MAKLTGIIYVEAQYTNMRENDGRNQNGDRPSEAVVELLRPERLSKFQLLTSQTSMRVREAPSFAGLYDHLCFPERAFLLSPSEDPCP